jgi:hypothetical protein
MDILKHVNMYIQIYIYICMKASGLNTLYVKTIYVYEIQIMRVTDNRDHIQQKHI